MISPYFANKTLDFWQRGKVLVHASHDTEADVISWDFSPAQLSHALRTADSQPEDYSPLLEMMLQDARQVYPPPDADGARKPARKAKPAPTS